MSATTSYPTSLSVPGRTTPLTLRPMTPADAPALHAFFCAIPETDLLFLRRDVTDRAEIDTWAEDVRRGATFTLLALAGDVIAGEASVHRSPTPWSRHVGEVRVVVAGDFRRSGLGTALVQAIFLTALERGLEKVIAEMTPDQTGAITVFQKLGFRVEGLLRGHMRDRRGATHDLLVMAHDTRAAAGLMDAYGVTGDTDP